jgi:lysine-N-methylase
MLREDGLCKIQAALGEEALSSVCGFYPRYVTELGLIREQGLSISCPEVARIVLQRQEPIRLKTYKTQDPLRYFHDLDPEWLLSVRQGRDRALQILQDRSLPFVHRLEEILRIAVEVEGHLWEDTEETPSADAYRQFRKEMYALFKGMEHLRSDWTELVEEGYKQIELHHIRDEICWEQLLSYYLFKYALRSAMDDNFLACVSMGILSVIFLQELYEQGNQEIVYLVQLYAKETEHNDDNLEAILEAMENNPVFSPASFRRVLRGLKHSCEK